MFFGARLDACIFRIEACLRDRLAQLKPDSVLNQSEFGRDIAATASHIFAGRSARKPMAEGHLLGTHMLVGGHLTNAEWRGPKPLYAGCDPVPIFKRN